MPLYALGDKEPSIDPSAFIHPDAVIIGDVTVGARPPHGTHVHVRLPAVLPAVLP